MQERFVFSPSVKGLQPHELEIDPNSDDVDMDGDAFFYKNIPFTGIWYCYYENGQIAEINHYLGGLPHGETKEWYENGQLKHQRTHVMSMSCLGEHITWYPNGIIKEYAKIAYGVQLAYRRFDEKGNLIGLVQNLFLDADNLKFAITNRKRHISYVQQGLMEPESLTPWTRILGLPEV